MRDHLRAVPEADLAAWTRGVIEQLHAMHEFSQTTGSVALFGGLRAEPDLLADFLPWLRARGWRAALFRCSGDNLVPYEVKQLADLQRGPLGVWEPVAARCREMRPSDMDIILVPGLAFSKSNGARLGRGGGFYDRLLARPDVGALRVGVAFQAQMVARIPCEPHDMRVKRLVTELECIEVPVVHPNESHDGCRASAA